jgi:hypothetical protein
MSNVFKVLYLDELLGLQGRLPDQGIVNIGGTSSPSFTVAGRGLLFSDGTSTDGTSGDLSVLQITLQGSYTASQSPAQINLSASKNFIINALDGKKFIIDADNGNVTVGGNLSILGSSTIVTSTVQNTAQVQIHQTSSSQSGLVIEPTSEAASTVPLITAKAVHGGPIVFSVSPTGLVNGIDLVDLRHDIDQYVSEQVIDGEFTLTPLSSTTKLTLPNTYKPGSTKVYIGGLRQKRGSDYTESAADELTLLFVHSEDLIDAGISIIIDYVIA